MRKNLNKKMYSEELNLALALRFCLKRKKILNNWNPEDAEL